MPKTHSILQLHKPDPRILVAVERAEGVCLAAAMVISAASLAAKFLPALGSAIAASEQIPACTSIAALACGAGLALATAEQSRRLDVARTCLGVLTVVLGLALSGGLSDTPHAALNRLVGMAFVCLGAVVVFAQSGNGLKGWAADAALLGAGWVTLALVAGAVLGWLRVFPNASQEHVEFHTAAMVSLLALSAAARRAEYGRLSIFVGRGLGSRIARGILPLVLLLPVSRELMRARLIQRHIFPDHYAAALLAATGTMIAVGLLLWISWQLRRLEWEIQSLSLRDELTGLYNLRGFHLLADQGLRMARRARMPFSVLFVDVDDLKLVNDRMGHAAGSQLLVEAAEFLKANFRETDVLGRVGGDEFAVAGQFSVTAIQQAESRLQALAAQRELLGQPRLSLSMGHVTADPRRSERLEDLLERADAAMYEHKRMKKLQTV